MDLDREKKDIDRQRLRRVLIAAGCVGAAIVLFFAVRHLVSPSVSLKRLRFGTIDRGDVRASIEATGTIQPGEERVLAAPFDSRVASILCKTGESLEPGTPLLTLDDRELRNHYDRISDEIALKRNQKDQLVIERERTLDRMKSDSEELNLKVEYLDAKTKQQQELYDMGAATDWALRQAQLDENIARLQVEHHNREFERTTRSLEKQIEGAGIEIKLLAGEQSELKTQLDEATVHAGIRGVLTWIVEETGASVRTGDVLARVADLSRFRAEASVSDIHINRLKVGMPVVIIAYQDTLGGVISSISPAVERGEVNFDIELDDPRNQALRVNLRVDVHVLYDVVHDALRLSKGASIQGSGTQEVFVLRGNELVRTKVTLGLAGVKTYEVVSGLSEGDRVVLSDMRDFMHLERIRLR
ncbi:MAG: HlyD family efflux transporter periplasmic adaptor subunit [bacterium]